MSRSRLSIGACVGAGILCITAFSGGAAARTTGATHANSVIKLGMITKFPVGFYFTLQNGAKKFDKATPGAKVVFAQGKSATDDAGEIAAIQDMVASGVKGIAIAPTSPAVVPALKKAIKAGVKIVLIDNDIPTWHGKSSVVATKATSPIMRRSVDFVTRVVGFSGATGMIGKSSASIPLKFAS